MTKKKSVNLDLRVENGKVTFRMRTGKDLVQNTMSEGAARAILQKGEIKPSDHPGFPICVDARYFFPAIATNPMTEEDAK